MDVWEVTSRYRLHSYRHLKRPFLSDSASGRRGGLEACGGCELRAFFLRLEVTGCKNHPRDRAQAGLLITPSLWVYRRLNIRLCCPCVERLRRRMRKGLKLLYPLGNVSEPRRKWEERWKDWSCLYGQVTCFSFTQLAINKRWKRNRRVLQLHVENVVGSTRGSHEIHRLSAFTRFPPFCCRMTETRFMCKLESILVTWFWNGTQCISYKCHRCPISLFSC